MTTATLPTVPPLPDQLIEGRLYPRPCVRAKWVGHDVAWLPVIGNVHSDPEHVKADFQHLHVDFRFLDQQTKDQLDRDFAESNNILCLNKIYSLPISYVLPEGRELTIPLDDTQLADIETESWLSVRNLPYQGEYPPYPHHIVHWTKSLGQAYADQSLINGNVCPHQGTDLSGITPGPDGIITCPLHGLRWHARTGRSAETPADIHAGD